MTPNDLNDLDAAVGYAMEWSAFLKSRGGIDSYDRGRSIGQIMNSAARTLNELHRELPGLLQLKKSADRAYDIHVTTDEGCSCHINPPCNYCVNQPDPDAEATQ